MRFKEIHEVLTFMVNVINEQPQWKINLNDYIEEKISRERLLRYISLEMCDFAITNKQYKIIVDCISKLDDEIVTRMYYKRNLSALTKNPKIIKMFLECLPKEGDIFNDPNKPLDYLKDPLGAIYPVIEEIVGYKYAYHDRYDRALTMRRNSVLLVNDEKFSVDQSHWQQCERKAS